jgi:DNA-binding NtrC family response regulator
MRPALRLTIGGDSVAEAACERSLAGVGALAKLSDTILVVEGDVLVRLATAAHLRDAGYRVVEAITAEEARAAIETGDVALVFSDINLPGRWQGTDLAGWVHAEFPAVKVILTSSAFHTVAGLRGCHHFIPKPYLPEEIAALARKLGGS